MTFIISDIPKAWLCPISMSVMIDPVIAADGHSYERSQITQWLMTSNKSPLTGLPLDHTHLVSNHALRSAIEEETTRRRDLISNATAVAASTQSGPRASISDCVKITSTGFSGDWVHLRVSASDDATPVPCALVAVIDVSGSMGLPASEKSDSDDRDCGFSRLDLVKHSMNTAIAMMRDTDLLQIVVFSDGAEVLFPLERMTSTAKARATECVGRMSERGGTNIWSGLETAIASVTNSKRAILPALKNHNVNILLLTDGEPTPDYVPPRGIVPSLKSRLSVNSKLTISAAAYGYGSGLDTPLLREIAELGNGTMGYIPDGSMVGTVMIHLVSNMLSTIASNLTLSLRDLTRVKLVGSLQVGQTRNVLAPKSLLANSVGAQTLTVSVHEGETFVTSFEVVIPCTTSPEAEFQLMRTKFIETISRSILFAQSKSMSDAHEDILRTQRAIEELAIRTADPRYMFLAEDLCHKSDASKGQIDKAVTFWLKWGQHYLPCVLMCHVREERGNFKDASMEIYGGEFVKRVIERGDELFATLPSIEPSLRIPTLSGDARFLANVASMHSRYNGCFSGDSLVQTPAGSARLDELRAGDIVSVPGATNDAEQATVVCVVEFVSEIAHKQELLRVSKDCGLTAWHPMKSAEGKWIFPDELRASVATFERDRVYNLVLSRGHCVRIGGVDCVTLGHGILNDPVASHDFWGTTRVLDALAVRRGWSKGRVVLDENKGDGCLRSAETGLVVGLSTETEKM